jgi:hypothetical protein
MIHGLITFRLDITSEFQGFIMGLHPDSVLALGFCEDIQRLLQPNSSILVQLDRPTREDTRSFLYRIQIAIIQ